VTSNYAQAIAGCDQSTNYQCGVQLGNTVDLSENPGSPNGDTLNGVQCLIHQKGNGGGSGEDSLAPGATPYNYPFQIQAGSSNPLVTNVLATVGDTITSSTSIVSIPIYDTASPTSPPTFTSGAQTTVTIVGFMQVFINSVNNNGDVDVTVMNVSGCGNGLGTTVSSPPLYGTSPVPVRLVTPP
jgi:hypothetical protein